MCTTGPSLASREGCFSGDRIKARPHCSDEGAFGRIQRRLGNARPSWDMLRGTVLSKERGEACGPGQNEVDERKAVEGVLRV